MNPYVAAMKGWVLVQLRLVKNRTFILLLAMLILWSGLSLMQPVRAADDEDEIDATMEWEPEEFEEAHANDGSIYTKITVTLESEDTVVEYNQVPDMVAAGMVDVYNLPAGLTCVVRAFDNDRCLITLVGNAEAHEAADSVDNLSIEFKDTAFTNEDADKIEDSSRTDIRINFDDSPAPPDVGSINWGAAEFSESEADDGTIANSLVITLNRLDEGFDGFVSSEDMVADGLVTVTNLPAGLTCKIVPTDRTHCRISLLGTAESNQAADSNNQLQIEFLDGAFTNNDASRVENSLKKWITIKYVEYIYVVIPPTAGATFVIGEVNYHLDGAENTMDVAPFSENDRVYVPLRYLAYSLGIGDESIVWNAGNQTASLTKNGLTVVLQIGNMAIDVGGTEQLMDVAPLARDNRIFLPVRFVVEAFSGAVQWVPEAKTVVVVRAE